MFGLLLVTFVVGLVLGICVGWLTYDFTYYTKMCYAHVTMELDGTLSVTIKDDLPQPSDWSNNTLVIFTVHGQDFFWVNPDKSTLEYKQNNVNQARKSS